MWFVLLTAFVGLLGFWFLGLFGSSGGQRGTRDGKKPASRLIFLWRLFLGLVLGGVVFTVFRLKQNGEKFDPISWTLWTRAGRYRPSFTYNVSLESFPEHYQKAFVPFGLDSETRHWLEEAKNSSMVKLQVSKILRAFMSRTTANGILNRGHMHIFSPAQASSFLQRSEGDVGHLLDIGAGDGDVTDVLAPLFSNTSATEVSWSMRWRLRMKGYDVVSEGAKGAYDVVSCLNVIDRCDHPLRLLESMREMLKPGGRILLAVVLPWSPIVEQGRKKFPPKDRLPMDGAFSSEKPTPTFERAAQIFLSRVIQPAGFVVERWTRLPYLCDGGPRLAGWLKAGGNGGRLAGRLKAGGNRGGLAGRLEAGGNGGGLAGQLKAGGNRGGLAGRLKAGGNGGGLAGRLMAGGNGGGLAGRLKAGGNGGGLAGRLKAGGNGGGLAGRLKAGGNGGGLAGRLMAGGNGGGLAGWLTAGGSGGGLAGRLKAGGNGGGLAGRLTANSVCMDSLS
uniref:Methyltransferase type 11 domain-containing protein n=1 Tax=Chromera velia CCMP2878 TaxID=1169474 RepID=A0A0G4HSM3_9ALVE|eukprot:Cvel_31127.t1-p1 / transcript=Cvel_31127.t1 / gene=Cvel_31127 / organism=Chromera_velia_CCMP2878 / gene_product=Methyltransferase-like protein 9, putative / transcript_product=Methyltransferase-like protein 9, putative / location=Cvel_scaffold4576:477-6034(+) / protein_length=502 / sequence_SO=supercontig / SO=protein_coding / is_pseudo=false